MSRQDGFEYQGNFYPLSVTDVGKDLMLIDRIAQIPWSEFVELVSEAAERTPVMLALIATSLRRGHPEWSVEKIYRIVMNENASSFEWVSAEDDEDEEDEPRPPDEPAADPASPASPSNGSSSPPTPAVSATSATSSGTRA